MTRMRFLTATVTPYGPLTFDANVPFNGAYPVAYASADSATYGRTYVVSQAANGAPA